MKLQTPNLDRSFQPRSWKKKLYVLGLVLADLLTSRRPPSAISNSSSLRPPLTASGMSRSSSSSASVKWDEEGLEMAKEMRKKDREGRRRNSTDFNAVLNGTAKKGSRRSAEGRKRPLVSDLFADVYPPRFSPTFICRLQGGPDCQHRDRHQRWSRSCQ